MREFVRACNSDAKCTIKWRGSNLIQPTAVASLAAAAVAVAVAAATVVSHSHGAASAWLRRCGCDGRLLRRHTRLLVTIEFVRTVLN